MPVITTQPDAESTRHNELVRLITDGNNKFDALLHIVADHSRQFGVLTEEIRGMRTEMTEMRKDITEIRSDIVEIREDITEIRGDIVAIQKDIVEIREDIAEMRKDISHLQKDQSATYELLEDMAESISDTLLVKKVKKQALASQAAQ